MAYHYSRTGDLPFAQAVEATVASLKEQGCGVLTDIDVEATLKNKLGVDFRRYRILGACNPKMAHRALEMEDKIGTMLPCNVIVQQLNDGRVEVASVDPVESMRAIENPELHAVAGQVRELLVAAVDGIAG